MGRIATGGRALACRRIAEAMRRLKTGHRVSSAAFRRALLAAAALVLLGVLALPQPAQAYDLWYKVYDADMNLLFSYDKDAGNSQEATSIDIDKVQEGIYFEFYYNGSDGDPLPSVLNYIQPVCEINEVKEDGTRTYAAGEQRLKRFEDDDTELSAEDQIRDENGYFAGEQHWLMFLSVKTLSAGSSLSFKLGGVPYIRNGGVSYDRWGTDKSSFTLGLTPGEDEEDEDEDEGGEEGPASSSDSTEEGSESGGEAGKEETKEEQTEDDESKEPARDDSGKDASDSTGSSDIAADDEGETGRTSDSDEEGRHETVAAATGEPDDSDGNDSGSDVADDAEDAAQTESDESAAEADARAKTASRADASETLDLSDLGTVFALNQTANEAQGGKTAAASQLEITGAPLLYELLVALFALMAPAGLVVRALARRRAGTAKSRFIGV